MDKKPETSYICTKGTRAELATPRLMSSSRKAEANTAIGLQKQRINPLCESSRMMEEAPRYGAWIAEAVHTHLKGHLLDVGCGTGEYTGHFAALPTVARVTAIDISPVAIALAQQRVPLPNVTFAVENVQTVHGMYDSLVCANVIEHIEDDRQFVLSLKKVVRLGGTLALLVPAHPRLYSRYDREAGHYRRYTKRGLQSLLTAAGLRIDSLFHFNMLGALGWLLSFKILQRGGVQEGRTRSLVRFFNRFFLPVGKRMESSMHPPFGISLIALCSNA